MPGERGPCTNWIGGWMDTRIVWRYGEEKIFYSWRESNASHAARTQVTLLTELLRLITWKVTMK